MTSPTSTSCSSACGRLVVEVRDEGAARHQSAHAGDPAQGQA